jgi:hypothetical protein
MNATDDVTSAGKQETTRCLRFLATCPAEKRAMLFHLYGVGHGVILPLIELFSAVEPERL